MNKEKKQHKESIIGKIIYGFLMFSPLLAILFTSLYVIINQNAKDSFTANSNNLNLVQATNQNTLQGNTLYFNYDTTKNQYNYTQYYYYNYISFNPGDYTGAILDYQPDGIRIINNVLALHNPNTNLWTNYAGPDGDDIWGNTLSNFTLTLSQAVTNNINGGNVNIQVIYQTQLTLDNAFYYAINKTEESNLFNWSKNTGIYSVLTTTCNGIGITTTFIPFILTYWLIISLIYLIYDLVLVFVHVAHNKIHELEEF